MPKIMTERLLIKLDKETRSKLDDLAEGSDMSKVIRGLILREWDVKNNSIRVPVAGKFNSETTFEDIEKMQEGIE